MKLIAQIIGYIVILLLIIGMVLFFLDSKSFLRGDFADYIHAMHGHWKQAVTDTISFMQNTGIANDAADLLQEGAEKLRSIDPAQVITPEPVSATEAVVIPEPTQTPPAIIIITPNP